MKLNIKIGLYGFLTIICCLTISLQSFAQETKYKKESKEYEKFSKAQKEYVNKAEKIGLIEDYNTIEYYRNNKVNLNKYQELKELGVDIIEVDKKINTNYKEAVLFSDNIIVGVVVKKEYHDDTSSEFKTTFHIEVEEILKGKVTPKTVMIHLRSGKIGDNYVSVSHEPVFFLGEKVLLYLNDFEGNNFKKYLSEGNKIDANFSKKILSKTKKSTLKALNFTVNRKYIVKSNYVFDHSKKVLGNIEKIKGVIKKINKTNLNL